MQNITTAKLELATRKQILENSRLQLKSEFIGLDAIIDQVVGLISTWYLYPELQERPTVINLWGMTGVGKTSLVKRLVQLISFEERFFHFDMGNNSDNVGTIKSFFKDLFQFDNGFPFIIGFDEFQYANTKDPFGNEVEKSYSRAVWELMDTGKFQVFRNLRFISDLVEILAELKFLVKQGVKVENGIVVEKLDYFLSVANKNDWGDTESICPSEGPDDIPLRQKHKRKVEQSFVRSGAVRDLYNTFSGRFASMAELKDYLLQLNAQETIELIEEGIIYGKSRKELDCSKSLIFILGNLDEVFHFCDSVNPDINPDHFYNRTKNVSITEVKKALHIRFRSEHIARLGNNHIVYPALNRKMYEQIIETELKKISNDASQRLGFELHFDQRIKKIIYKEGVFPSQGTRPLFSTIHQLVKSKMAHIKVTVIEKAENTCTVLFSTKKESMVLQYLDKTSQMILEETFAENFQVGRLSNSKNDELQAVTAVHESGHALLYILLTGRLPECIYSVSSDNNIAGMVIMNPMKREVLSRKKIIGKLAIFLGGLAAEEFVFGAENITVGSGTDLKQATSMAARILKKEGFLGKPYTIAVEDIHNEHFLFDRENELDTRIKSLLDESKALAMEMLRNHAELLMGLSTYLSCHSRLNRKQLQKILQQYPAINLQAIEKQESRLYRGILNNNSGKGSKLKKAS